MCGIAAFLGKSNPQKVEAVVRRMTEAQAHRGPDDRGVEVLCAEGGVIGLGHRRLAIQDLSPLGHQPMRNPETGDMVVYNGEIYNAPELRRDLEQEGHSFSSRSDTEVLLRAYQEWGTRCLERLRGMFAFALWDARRSRLLIARDHMGIKPLYYAAMEGEWFICASEVRALMSSGLVEKKISRAALAGYLAYGAVQEPLAIYEGVKVLPPATWRELDTSGRVVAEGAHWKLPSFGVNRNGRDTRDTMAEGRVLLEEAVRRHLLSDVRVGVFLSSGLDSTALLGIARGYQVGTEHVNAFTVSFSDEPKYDEAAIARRTAARFAVPYHEYPIEESTALAWVRDGLEVMDQPSMDGFNTYMVARAVREQGIAVALSGLGGDEIFAGYNTFRRAPRLYQAMWLVSPAPPVLRALAARSVTLPLSTTVRRKAEEIAALGADLSGIYLHLRRVLSDASLARLGLAAETVGLNGQFHLPEEVLNGCLTSGDLVASVARLESRYYLRNVLLRDGDVFGMANSLEIRVPMLDRDLVEWAFQLPGRALLPPGAPPKHLLQQMCGDLYTRSQFAQGKRGFSPPFGRWLLKPLRGLMEENLKSVKASGLVDGDGVDAVKRVFLREPHSQAWSRAWVLVTLGHWLAKHKSTAV